eukprot:GSMAST32.ASY1.ANO1.2323.1 assembled CDS
MPEDLEVILFYKYHNVDNVDEVSKSQTEICKKLKLSGRIRLAKEGINGLLSGLPKHTREYRDILKKDARFGDGNIQFKISRAVKCPFDGKLFIRQCSEITSTGTEMKRFLPNLPYQSKNKKNKKNKKNRQILIDTRNHYEVAVGSFKGAINPKIRCFAQFPEWVNSNKEQLIDADVYM